MRQNKIFVKLKGGLLSPLLTWNKSSKNCRATTKTMWLLNWPVCVEVKVIAKHFQPFHVLRSTQHIVFLPSQKHTTTRSLLFSQLEKETKRWHMHSFLLLLHQKDRKIKLSNWVHNTMYRHWPLWHIVHLYVTPLRHLFVCTHTLYLTFAFDNNGSKIFFRSSL
jgi:hypothetical protein